MVTVRHGTGVATWTNLAVITKGEQIVESRKTRQYGFPL